MAEFSERLVHELVDAVKDLLRELAIDSRKPIRLYINSAGGNVTDGLALHDAIRQLVVEGYQITIVVQGMAYSMGSIVLQAASDGCRQAFPHSWIMIHEPAKWAGWQSTTAAAQHLDRLKQMQAQIYRILAERSGKTLKQIIRDTKRTDFYLDAASAKEYGLIDDVLGAAGAVDSSSAASARTAATVVEMPPAPGFEHAPAASEAGPEAPDPQRTQPFHPSGDAS